MKPARHPAACVAVVLLTAGLVAATSAAPVIEAQAVGSIMLAVRDDGVTVRESYRVTLSPTSHIVRVPGIPLEADLSSLRLMDRRGDARLENWWRTGGADRRSGLSATVKGESVQLTRTDREPGRPGEVEIQLRVAAGGERTFDLVYAMTGITWKAGYDVLLRGELGNVTNVMSVDVDGWIELVNHTARSFSNALVSIVGEDRLGRTTPVKPPGFLVLDEDSPLSDLWLYQPPEKGTPHVYALPGRIDVPAADGLHLSHVAARRKPVDRIFLVRAEEIPTDARGVFAHPSQLIQFNNAADYGGGRAVPPGSALIYLGSQRSVLHQRAWFKHTPAQGDIRMDMGKLEGVTVRRIDRGRRTVPGQGVEQTMELRVENTLDQSLRLIIDEQPPINLAWTLLRSSHAHERTDRRLVFQPLLEPRSEVVIQYTMRVTLPGS